MKVTTEQALGFLKGLGLDAQLVEDVDASDFDETVALQAVDASRKPILKPQIEQEVGEALRSNTAGMMDGALMRHLKRATGFNFEGLAPDAKWEDKLKAAIDFKVAQLDKDKQSVQEEVDNILKKHQEEVDRIKSESAKELQAAQQRYIDRDIYDTVLGKLKDAPLLPTADRSIVSKDLKGYLESKYNVKYNDQTKDIELYDKANPEMPAMNEAKTARVDILAEAKGFFTPRGVWATDTRNINPGDVQRGNANEQYQSGTNGKKVITISGDAASKRKSFLEQVNTAAAANS